jgi:HAE1 family hydrophobic/amphiphilic exporter-1
MKFAHFFVDRPVFAAVLSIAIVVLGAIGYWLLPVARYPDIVPPTIYVEASYPGANAETVAKTVTAVLERELNGLEDLLYMTSNSSDGSMWLGLIFRVGTNLDRANVNVQERITTAQGKLPLDVRNAGITTAKRAGNLLLIVDIRSSDKSRDQLYLSNYAAINVRDQLARIDGIGQIPIFGMREYALRVWLNPDKLSAYSLTTGDVLDALREQNQQVAAGAIGAPPVPSENAFKLTVRTQGRLSSPRQFEKIIIKAAGGRLVRLSDVATVELAARDYADNAYVDGAPTVGLGIYARPGTNVLKVAEQVAARMKELGRAFPAGVEYSIVYNPTKFVRDSINEVYRTLFEALVLVVVVVIVFLQSWRSALIPLIAIPISIIGSFALMAVLGFSLNSLTLFGLVLAIGIVVDDAIVFVENVESNIAAGMSPREASHKTIDQAGTAIVAISVVLLAVFVPAAFLPGITGEFYRQFALTIAASTVISTIVSLTLTPAMCAALLRRHAKSEPSSRPVQALHTAGDLFNRGFLATARSYAAGVKRIAHRRGLIAGGLVVYAALACGTATVAQLLPTGFIPAQDAGYLTVSIDLPAGASLARTDEVTRRVSRIVRDTPGVAASIEFPSSNSASVYLPLLPFAERRARGLTADAIKTDLEKRLEDIQEADISVSTPPAVNGLGRSGGFQMWLQDRGGIGNDALLAAAREFVARVNKQYGNVFEKMSEPHRDSTPQIYVDVDRAKARMLGVPLASISETIQVNLGGSYVNDFNAFGRAYQVIAQAQASFREERERILKLKVRNQSGDLVSLGSLVTIRDVAGPSNIDRHNGFNAMSVEGTMKPNVSSGIGLDIMEKLARDTLPPGVGFEWTELAFHQRAAAGNGAVIFVLSVLFVFLVLAALYESWLLPLAIVLIVPLCVLSALTGVWLREMDNNILTQVGLVLLIGLACKNAILIVEFARQAEQEGATRLASIVQAARQRLRPILMTTLAFVFGVAPLMVAKGAGAELHQALGTAVFAGMIGVTLFGLFLTPIFYVAIRNAADWLKGSRFRPASGQCDPAAQVVSIHAAPRKLPHKHR